MMGALASGATCNGSNNITPIMGKSCSSVMRTLASGAKGTRSNNCGRGRKFDVRTNFPSCHLEELYELFENQSSGFPDQV